MALNTRRLSQRLLNFYLYARRRESNLTRVLETLEIAILLEKTRLTKRQKRSKTGLGPQIAPSNWRAVQEPPPPSRYE